MTITKCASTDAFVAIDLADAPTAVGVVRCAKKILQDGAVNLARSLTYTYAAFGEQVSGASAGINAEGEARDGSVEAFVTELAPSIESGALRLLPAKGVTAEDLAAWPAPAVSVDAQQHDHSLAVGVVAAAGAVRSLDGASVQIEAGAPGADAIAAAFAAAGANAAVAPLTELLGAGADIVVVGSKNGVLHHDNVTSLGSAVIVGAAGLAITARGLAVAGRQGAVVLPDFVTAAGPALAGRGHNDDVIASKVAEVISSVADHAEGPYLGACYRAEEFMSTWTAALPFGRPMA